MKDGVIVSVRRSILVGWVLLVIAWMANFWFCMFVCVLDKLIHVYLFLRKCSGEPVVAPNGLSSGNGEYHVNLSVWVMRVRSVLKIW